MVRQAVRQAHGPEQRRRTHHPEQRRRVNLKFDTTELVAGQYSMTKTNQLLYSNSHLCFEFVFLVIVICLIFGICYLKFTIIRCENVDDFG